MYRFLAPFVISLLFNACTFTITTVHTQGKAADVVDDTSSVTPTVSPDVNIPISGI